MIEAELNNLIKKLNISADQILREYAEMIFLNILAKDKISAKLAFSGGTALRLAYDSPRFSEDIDLIVIKQIKFSEFKDLNEELQELKGIILYFFKNCLGHSKPDNLGRLNRK